MTFVNPSMLAGLAAAFVPLVLHFLNRARYRDVEWGGMMFLDGLETRQFQSSRLKQWGLLALRALVVALLACAMARPVLHARGLAPTQPGRTAAVIVLDRSASMGMKDNGRVRLDSAREAVFQLLSPGLKRGDDEWLVTLGERDPDEKPRYAGDPQEMAGYVKEVVKPSGRADVAAGLREAIDLLDRAEAPNREIYVVCDQQASSWRDVDEAFVRDWRRAVARLPRPPRLFVVPVGTGEAANVAVSRVAPVRPPVVAEQSVDVEVRLRNYGPVPRADVGVEAWVDASPQKVRRTVNLPARGEAGVVLPLRFNDAGSHVVNAAITAPGLESDTLAQYSVDVIKDLHVLIVDGDEPDGSLQGGADFLALALAPFPAASKRNTARVTAVRPDAWGAADLRDARLVFLSNVQTVSEAQAESLLQFVYGGGGLLVTPGDQTRVDNYNALLPWLPATLAPAIAEGEGSTALGNVDLNHPLFRFLGGKLEPAPVAVRRYFPAAPRKGAKVLGSYADGKPFLVECAAGRGRVLLMTTPIDTDWNALPLTHLFVPFAQSAVRYAANGLRAARESRRNLLAGQPIVAEFDGVGEPIDPDKVVVQFGTTGVRSPDVAVSQFGGDAQVRFARTSAPGQYVVTIPVDGGKSTRSTRFVLRNPPEESDLAPLGEVRWAELERGLNCERVDSERRSPAESQEASRAGTDLWLPLLGAAVVLSLLELSAARRWAGRDR